MILSQTTESTKTNIMMFHVISKSFFYDLKIDLEYDTLFIIPYPMVLYLRITYCNSPSVCNDHVSMF